MLLEVLPFCTDGACAHLHLICMKRAERSWCSVRGAKWVSPLVPCNLAALVRVHFLGSMGTFVRSQARPSRNSRNSWKSNARRRPPSIRTIRTGTILGPLSARRENESGGVWEFVFFFFWRFLAKLAHGMELALFYWSLATSFRNQLHCEMLTKWSFKSLWTGQEAYPSQYSLTGLTRNRHKLVTLFSSSNLKRNMCQPGTSKQTPVRHGQFNPYVSFETRSLTQWPINYSRDSRPDTPLP